MDEEKEYPIIRTYIDKKEGIIYYETSEKKKK